MARPEIESSVQMRLYTLTKRQFIVVFSLFLLAFVFFLLIGVAGPDVIRDAALNASCTRLRRGGDGDCSVWQMKTPSLTTYNQQLWLTASLKLAASPGATADAFVKRLEVGVDVLPIYAFREMKTGFADDATFQYNRTRKLSCDGGSCDDLVVLHMSFLDASAYLVRVSLEGLESLDVAGVVFRLETFNPAFTELEIWMRVIFLFLSFAVSCWFVQSMKKFAFRDWSLEQRFLALLLPLLLFYNNPVFPLNFLTSSWLPGTLDGFFQASFLCSLLLFWICVYHGIRVNERHFLSFFAPKLAIVGLLWLSSFVLSTWRVRNSLRDPTFSLSVDAASDFSSFRVFLFVVVAVYVLYLAYLLVRAFAEFKSVPYVDLRLKFLTLLMAIVMGVSLAVFVMRFGSTTLEDTFVSELSSNYRNSAEFLAFYSLLNLYVFLMSYVYSPSKHAAYQTHFRDNPTMSMIAGTDDEEEEDYDDDEDDDVVYEDDRHKKSGRKSSGGKKGEGKKGKKKGGVVVGGKRTKRLIDYGASDEEDLFHMDYSGVPF